MAIAAFWIAVAAFIVVGALNARRGYELKHETIRMMLEKGQKIDEAMFRELTAPSWQARLSAPPGRGYRIMRVWGTMALFVAPGVALAIFLPGWVNGSVEQQAAAIGLGVLIALIGIGLHVACRFLAPPSQRSTPV